MARSVNKLTLIGNLGADPELHTSQRGTSYCRISIATTRYNPKSDAEPITDWHNVTVFGQTAEYASNTLSKGSLVYIEGRVEYNKYERDGQTTYGTSIIANELVNMAPRREGGAPQQNYSSNSASSGNNYQQSKPAATRQQPAQAPASSGGFDDEDLPF